MELSSNKRWFFEEISINISQIFSQGPFEQETCFFLNNIIQRSFRTTNIDFFGNFLNDLQALDIEFLRIF